MTCYGNGQWEMIDYGDVEAAGDMDTQSHEAVRLGRYLSITTNYGNVIDGLKYTAVSDMFYEFSGIAYSPLAEEQAASVCEIIGIMKSEVENGQSYDVKTDDAHQENDNSDDGAGTILFENTNTDVSLEYVTELQTKVSSAMMNHEVPFVISSSVYENPYRLHVVVTSNAEEDLQRLRDLEALTILLLTLAGTTFCRSNRKEPNPAMACEAYRQGTEKLKSYMQRQWSLVGGMAGTFGEGCPSFFRALQAIILQCSKV